MDEHEPAVFDAAWETICDAGNADALVARLVDALGSEAQATRVLAQEMLDRTRTTRDRLSRLSSDNVEAHDLVISLITETLHRRALDETDPIPGDPLTNLTSARKLLDRIDVEHDLISQILGTPNAPEDTIAELATFAAMTFEWAARRTHHEPLALLQEIVRQWNDKRN